MYEMIQNLNTLFDFFLFLKYLIKLITEYANRTNIMNKAA